MSLSFLCWEPKNWMQYCRWSCTRAEQRDRVLSLTLLAKLLFVQPSMQLTSRVERACSRFISNFSSTSVPKSRRAALNSQPLLGTAELHEVHIVSVLKPIKVPLNSILSLQHISCTAHLSVICKLAENALNPLFLSVLRHDFTSSNTDPWGTPLVGDLLRIQRH